jgi:hypothetical protein
MMQLRCLKNYPQEEGHAAGVRIDWKEKKAMAMELRHSL